ncbi:unnamed protein product [Miscanthus lutarioriparius]|uniref:Late embryogenesis abundant protein LEA-2 subgroup domain-containing protein n=1 Tax=Miscanthus lutarioriparius TaxID=422564 RepID=A0A811SAN5_9POAL|nr:unnamed protein product [Miscanthus lutarioriparius]
MASPSPLSSASRLRALNPKHYILLALTATLAVAVVVTVFFIVMSPARIHFSVTNASSHRLQSYAGDGGVLLNLTLASNNTSRRAAVRYQSMFVDVSNNTGPQWVYWIRANVTPTTGVLAQWQPRASVATVTATVLVGAGSTKAFTGNMTSHRFSVKVTAVARFKVGIARTRLYDIMVVCRPIDFFPRDSCSRASAAASAAQPVAYCV